MKRYFEEIARMIFERGLDFGAFTLKHHEKRPNDPRSPFKINLRTPDHPSDPGRLTPADCELAGRALWQAVHERSPDFQFLAGIPHAGEVFAGILENIIPPPRGFEVIRLAKERASGGRRIVPLIGFRTRQTGSALLIDDVIDRGNSKFEAIEAMKQIDIRVKYILVLVNRGRDGLAGRFRELGCELIWFCTAIDLFEYYRAKGWIDDAIYWECFNYIKHD